MLGLTSVNIKTVGNIIEGFKKDHSTAIQKVSKISKINLFINSADKYAFKKKKILILSVTINVCLRIAG